MSKSASIVYVTSIRNSMKSVSYNEQEKKISGDWDINNQDLKKEDLISFTGDANRPYLSINEQISKFRSTMTSNQRMYEWLNKISLQNNRYLKARTLIQSFDYHANPNLDPKEVHQMGIELWRNFQIYLKDEYELKLENGLVSTHIDKNISDEGTTHLHNHILIGCFNSEGKNISSYIRKKDIYQLQKINDGIVNEHNLIDYRFLKLKSSLNISSKIKQNIEDKNANGNRVWNLETATERIRKQNNESWNIYPRDFRKAIQHRDRSLENAFGYRKKHFFDKRINKSVEKFTMNDFKDSQGKFVWYNTKSLKINYWGSEKDAIAEQAANQIDFSGTENILVSKEQYEKTMDKVINRIEPLDVRTKNKISIYQIFSSMFTFTFEHVKKYSRILHDNYEIIKREVDDEYRRKQEQKIKNGGSTTPLELANLVIKNNKLTSFTLDKKNSAQKKAVATKNILHGFNNKNDTEMER